MKIMLVTAYFPPEVGSASHLYHELGTALLEFGHEVTVLTTLPGYNAQGDLSKYRRRLWMSETVDGMRVVRVASPRLPRRLMFGRAIWQFGTAIEMAVAGAIIERPDAAIVYSPPLPLGLAAYAVRLLKGVPFVLNVQDLFPQSAVDLGLLRNGRLIRVFEGLERFLYRKSTLITVHSALNGEHVTGKGACPDRVRVVHNWVDCDAIRPAGRGGEFRQRLGLRDEFVVSFGGVIAYSQDIDVILNAADKLRHRTDIGWLVAGDGVEKSRLIALASEKRLDNVTFLPMLPLSEYAELLQASDVCLATLRAEVKTPVVPSKIMSIMAAGKPVLASMDLEGDAPRLIAEAGCGVTVEPGNADALADAVLAMAGDAEARARYGRSGRAYAERHLSLQHAADVYSGLIAEMTGATASSEQRA
jgi:glycosyltransferase involved in cell wall biosynthesis